MSEFFKEINENGEYKYLIDGRWAKSKSGATIDIMSPIDSSFIGKVQAVNRTEIDEIIESAKKAFDKWSHFTIEDRAAMLERAAELILANKDEIADAKVLEVGKTRKSAMGSVERSAGIVSYTAKQIEIANHNEILFSKDFPGAGDKKATQVIREPIGIVLAISPFNYPINLMVTKLAPALLAGNCVIIKGPTQGSICTAMLAEVFNKAGFPAGVVSFVSGKGSEIGDYLVSHKDIGAICFTGSSEVGKGITNKAGIKTLILELGGKDAALVLPDADIDLAATQICEGAFSYAGQRCTAIKRVFVDKSIHDEFLLKLIQKTREKFGVVGDPRKDETQVGPVISAKQADFIQELIFDAVENGAKIAIGSTRKDNYIDATILDGVKSDMRIAWEEQFGPVLPIIICSDINEMIELHNQSQYGLGASIFTKDMGLANEIARKLQVGVVQINAKSERYPDNFPFLGVKDSGLGTQGIRWSIEAMSKIKSIVDNKG
jgi:glyceraldehyde-3-phosphate dehydrogenase (NADP+)